MSALFLFELISKEEVHMNSAMTVEEIKAKIKANYVEMYKLYYSGNYVPLLTEAEDSTEEVGKAV